MQVIKNNRHSKAKTHDYKAINPSDLVGLDIDIGQ